MSVRPDPAQVERAREDEIVAEWWLERDSWPEGQAIRRLAKAVAARDAELVAVRAELAESRRHADGMARAPYGEFESMREERDRERAAREAAERERDEALAAVGMFDSPSAAEADHRRLRDAMETADFDLTAGESGKAHMGIRAALAGLGETTASQSGAAAEAGRAHQLEQALWDAEDAFCRIDFNAAKSELAADVRKAREQEKEIARKALLAVRRALAGGGQEQQT